MAITLVTVAFSALMAIGKFVLGLFSGFVVSITGLFSFFILLAKVSSLIGIKKGDKALKAATVWTAVFLFAAGSLYLGYMGRAMFVETQNKGYSRIESIGVAAIAFFELGIAIYGLVRTSKTGFLYRDIKVVNFVSALAAIVTAQIALLSFEDHTGFYNGITGSIVGLIAVASGLYVILSPRIGIRGNEEHSFSLMDADKNFLIEIEEGSFEVALCHDYIYGDISFKGEAKEGRYEGRITKGKGFWGKTPIWLKIVYIILSEILIFVYLIGYAIYLIRIWNMPKRLRKLFAENGFTEIPLKEKEEVTAPKKP